MSRDGFDKVSLMPLERNRCYDLIQWSIMKLMKINQFENLAGYHCKCCWCDFLDILAIKILDIATTMYVLIRVQVNQLAGRVENFWETLCLSKMTKNDRCRGVGLDVHSRTCYLWNSEFRMKIGLKDTSSWKIRRLNCEKTMWSQARIIKLITKWHDN